MTPFCATQIEASDSNRGDGVASIVGYFAGAFEWNGAGVGVHDKCVEGVSVFSSLAVAEGATVLSDCTLTKQREVRIPDQAPRFKRESSARLRGARGSFPSPAEMESCLSQTTSLPTARSQFDEW